MQRGLPLLVIGCALLLAPLAHAAGQATPDEAKTMAIKAAEYLKAVGPEKAFPEFTAKDGPWYDRDLYVIVQNNQGVMLVNGPFPALVGRNVLNLKDPDGEPFNQDQQAITDAGWVHFRWMNPATKAIEPKTTYVVRVGDYLLIVGAYAK
jgi:hypothetical protein